MLNKELLQSRINEAYIQTFIGQMPRAIDANSLMILGHGRSGKDTVAEFLNKHYGYRFEGTSSTVLCNAIYPENPQEMYRRRHDFRQELFEFGNAIRDIEPRYIPWMTLRGSSDLLVGLRSSVDISAALDTCVSACVWIHSDVPDDPTMDYDLKWLVDACCKGVRTLGRVDGGAIRLDRPKTPLYFLTNIKEPGGLEYLYSQSKELVNYLKSKGA